MNDPQQRKRFVWTGVLAGVLLLSLLFISPPAPSVPSSPSTPAILARPRPRQPASRPEARCDVTHLLHSEQEFTWSRHPEVGEEVVAEGRVEEDVERRNLRFLTFATDVRSGGEPLCSSRMVNVIRG